MKTLVAGWFSFAQMGATAGDLLVRDVVCEWLDSAGCPYDVALAKPFSGGVDWQVVNAADYSHVVFLCGPFGNGWPVTDFLSRFHGRKFVGVNLTMIEALESWNPFDLLVERDSSRASRPDLALLSEQPLVPVLGVVLIDEQPEYRERNLHGKANDAIRRLISTRGVCAVPIDTRLDVNNTGLRSAQQVESMIARMDAVLTTRLHGLVLALKNGVPVVAIDPIAGGAKIQRQARSLRWPVVFTADSFDEIQLAEAFDYCLTEGARNQARNCCAQARKSLSDVRATVLGALLS